MQIKNLTVAGLQQIQPMKMTVITRGRKPHKNVIKRIEVDDPHLVIRDNNQYLHCFLNGEKKSFGPGTEVIFE